MLFRVFHSHSNKRVSRVCAQSVNKNPNFMLNKRKKKMSSTTKPHERLFWITFYGMCNSVSSYSFFPLSCAFHLCWSLSTVCTIFEIWKQSNNPCIWIMDNLWFITQFILFLYYFNTLCLPRIAKQLSRRSHYTKRWKVAELHAIQMTIFDTVFYSFWFISNITLLNKLTVFLFYFWSMFLQII